MKKHRFVVAAAAAFAVVGASACTRPVAPARPPMACGAPLPGGEALSTSANSGVSMEAGISPETGMLVVRVQAPQASQLFVDTDSDRTTGMWSAQSAVSPAGWDLLADGSGLYRHNGPPNKWQWEPAAAEGYGMSHDAKTTTFCVPAGSVGTNRVRVAVAAGDAWAPAIFRPGVTVPPSFDLDRDEPTPNLEGLAIDYSPTPWVVRGCKNPLPVSMDCAADVFGKFGHVVLSSGLEDPRHSSHERATKLIRAIRKQHAGTEVWGYVSMVGSPDYNGDGAREQAFSVDDILLRARWWKETGVTGVFLDEADLCDPAFQKCFAGPKGSVAIDRARQVAVVEGIHELGLAVFANGHSAFDVLGTIGGVPTPLGRGSDGRRADMYLLENPTIVNGARTAGLDAEVSRAKFEEAAEARRIHGIRIAVVDTGGTERNEQNDSLFEIAKKAAKAGKANAFGYANPSFSAVAELNADLVLPSGIF